MSRIPFLIVGDGPAQPTGLSRIATDLAAHLYQHQDALNLDVRHCGWVPWPNLPRTGTETHIQGVDWPTWVFSSLQRWGADAVSHAYRQWFGDTNGIIFSVWDPSRCFDLVDLPLPARYWGYFAVDAVNLKGTIGGPAADAIRRYHRILAYGPFGQKALEKIKLPVDHLPHGINLTVFDPAHRTAPETLRRPDDPDDQLVIGCVAANQRRKDLALFIRVLADLEHQGFPIRGWLHTDETVTEHWSIPELTDVCDFFDLVVTTRLPDDALADAYATCDVTIAPGRGEGFGYPIVESLAMDVPAIHCDYAGGADLLPANCLVAPYAWDIDGPYAVRRPLLRVEDVTQRVVKLLDDSPLSGYRPYVSHLDWPTLWPKWRAWIEAGL